MRAGLPGTSLSETFSAYGAQGRVFLSVKRIRVSGKRVGVMAEKETQNRPLSPQNRPLSPLSPLPAAVLYGVRACRVESNKAPYFS